MNSIRGVGNAGMRPCTSVAAPARIVPDSGSGWDFAHSVLIPLARPAHPQGMPPSSESGRDLGQVVKLCWGAFSRIAGRADDASYRSAAILSILTGVLKLLSGRASLGD